MALRKANSYSKKKVGPFTRKSSVKSKVYIKTIPPKIITKFSMGKDDLSKFKYRLTLVSCEKVQLRQNAIESCRQHLHRKLDEKFTNQYFFKIFPYPHHIQRENRMITGAGADRMQTGMQLSFGVSMNIAAIIKPEDKIFLIAVPNEKAVIFAREILNTIKSKLPCKTRIDYKFLG
ncbi:MAG: 50S ribosomal protein L16 [Nanoarchaeota archaeon]|nr:50S ribosomal protein L16 [Nanoarchaeota archaeon]